MIRAEQFVEAARARSFDWYAGVPCSFLTPFIDHVIDEDGLTYVSAANEGDAVAAAAGAALGGRGAVAMMQNSGLGNAVSPLTSLTWVFRIPVLLVVTWRGQPGLGDEPQHRLMGRITGRMLDSMEIPWRLFPEEPGEIGPALDRAAEHLAVEGRPYALLMRRGTVASRPPSREPPPVPRPTGAPRRTAYGGGPRAPRPSRGEALERIAGLASSDGTVVIASTGHTGRQLYDIADRPNQFYMVGSMGCAASLGLGLSMARPDLQVIVVEGDGAALMRMGNLATAGAYAGPNFRHVLLDNEMHASTGGQMTVSGSVSFAGVAAACGYRTALEGDDPDLLEEAVSAPGPSFVQLKISPGSPSGLPRPSVSPEEVRARLMAHVGSPGAADRRPRRAAGGYASAARNGQPRPDAAGPDLRPSRQVLLNPGPVNLSERVRRALQGPDLCHREPEFGQLQEEIRTRLLAVYGLDPERWVPALLSGSGTAAVEAMISSLVPRQGRLLVLENGVYGERMSGIAARHAIPVIRVEREWGAPLDPADLARELDRAEAAAEAPTHVAVVHHETTTGRLNDLASIGAVCRKRRVGLLVDAVSSFGGERLDPDAWGVSACAGTANKCLHGAPGLAFVIVARDAFPDPARDVRTLYLDLANYAGHQDRGDTPFTPAVPAFQALAEALRELEDSGGWSTRRRAYRRLGRIVEDGFRELGIRPLLPREASSVALRAYRLPAPVTYDLLHDGLKRRGFVIYAGQGRLGDEVFRVSTMGDLSPSDLERLVEATAGVLEELSPAADGPSRASIA